MDIKHNAGQRRFEIEVDGYKAHVAYSIHDNGLDIRHTIVPSEIGGMRNCICFGESRL